MIEIGGAGVLCFGPVTELHPEQPNIVPQAFDRSAMHAQFDIERFERVRIPRLRGSMCPGCSGDVEEPRRPPPGGSAEIGLVALAEIVTHSDTPKRNPMIGADVRRPDVAVVGGHQSWVGSQGACAESTSTFSWSRRNEGTIWNFPIRKRSSMKNCLVISRAVLVQRNDGSRSCRAAHRENSRRYWHVIERVARERRIAMINDAAKGESATPEHRALAPFFSKTQVDPAIIECFVAEGRAGRKYGRVYEHRAGRIARLAAARESMSWCVYQPLACMSQPSPNSNS